MVDENPASSAEDVPPAVTTPELAARPKKPSAPRRTKAEMEAAAAQKASRGGRKRKEGAASAAAVTAQGPIDASAKKATGRKPGAKSASTAAPSNLAATEDFADILGLETENKRLRKLLAEKLHAENADLRKKLGLV